MRIKQGFLLEDIAGEKVVIMQGKAGMDMTKIIAFNPVAAWLWSIYCDGREFDSEEVAQALVKQYALEPETATTDACRWLQQLADVKLTEA